MRTAAGVGVSAVAVAGAALIGGSYGPQDPRSGVWYASLRKPAYTPSGPMIGVTWGLLESLLFAAGVRLLTRPPSRARSFALGGWWATLAGLAIYPAVFFGRKRLGESAVVATAMCAATAITAVAAERTDKLAALEMAPLVMWTGFAVLLSEELWRMRR